MIVSKFTFAAAMFGASLSAVAGSYPETGGSGVIPAGYYGDGWFGAPRRPMPHPMFRVPAAPGYGTRGYPSMTSVPPGFAPTQPPAASVAMAESPDGPVSRDVEQGAAASMVDETNKAEAKEIVQQFFGRLKGELEAAIKTGGPAHAVGVCQVRAPSIAEELSQQTGWEVARTSLKYRNPANAPDEWEKGVLQRFEERKAAGEDVKGMAHAEIVENGGQSRLRFMKAIPTAGVCLACHGEAIADDVVAAIDEGYPADLARGYKLGDIRGAFSLSKPDKTRR
jgi:hypothetical protein